MSLIQMSLSGGAVILVIALLRALALYRLPKRLFAALWGLPLIRLLVPFSIPAAFSVYSLLDRQAPQAPTTNEAPALPHVPAVFPGEAVAAPTVESAPSIDPFLVIWLIGMLACAVFFVAAYVRCCQKFRESLPISNGYVQVWLNAHPLRRTVSVRYSDRISAPLTYGVFRPVILMPKSTDWDDFETIDYVLAHELAHIRRFDALRKLVYVLALCVHWFNPLVWVMCVLANRDMELACDEAVLHQLGGKERANYALALICMEERKSGLLLLGSHFSKNSIEERISAIMKINKSSLAVLLAALVLAGGASAFFATSAKAENNKNNSFKAAYASEGNDILLRDDSNGELYYSPDGGKTWELMTEEELEERTAMPGVEWWTADEYATWLENEKKELEGIIGEKGWTPSTGWFTWTEEMVAETIAEYEEILAKIRDGYLVSKTVDGSEDTMLMMNPLDMLLGSGLYGESTEVCEDDSMASFGAVDYDSLFANYKRCGLTIDGNLYWNGQRVRIFVDGVEHESGWYSQYEHYDPDGTVDLHTVRKRVDNGDGSYNLMGPLVRIEEFEPDLMFLDALEGQRYFEAESQYDADFTAGELERYTPFGLTYTYDPKSETGGLTMYWNGQRVRSLFDAQRQLWIANSLGNHGIDIEAVYENGRLTGLKIAEDSDREFVETGMVVNAETTAAYGGDASGETIAQRMERYAPYGVTYEERGGKRTIRYNGQTVGSFADKGPGGVFSLQSTDTGSVDLRAVYDSQGKLCGVEIV